MCLWFACILGWNFFICNQKRFPGQWYMVIVLPCQDMHFRNLWWDPRRTTYLNTNPILLISQRQSPDNFNFLFAAAAYFTQPRITTNCTHGKYKVEADIDKYHTINKSILSGCVTAELFGVFIRHRLKWDLVKKNPMKTSLWPQSI